MMRIVLAIVFACCLGWAAVPAVYKWRFSPTTVNGEPKKVTGTVTTTSSFDKR